MPSSPSTERGILGDWAAAELCQVRHNNHMRHQAGIPTHNEEAKFQRLTWPYLQLKVGGETLATLLSALTRKLQPCLTAHHTQRALNTIKALLIWFSRPKGDSGDLLACSEQRGTKYPRLSRITHLAGDILQRGNPVCPHLTLGPSRSLACFLLKKAALPVSTVSINSLSSLGQELFLATPLGRVDSVS